MRTYEVTVTGKAYKLPVNFGAIRALDERGVDIFALVALLASKKQIPAPAVVSLLAVGISLGEAVAFDEAAEMVMRHGVMVLAGSAAGYLLQLATGDVKAGKVGAPKK